MGLKLNVKAILASVAQDPFCPLGTVHMKCIRMYGILEISSASTYPVQHCSTLLAWRPLCMTHEQCKQEGVQSITLNVASCYLNVLHSHCIFSSFKAAIPQESKGRSGQVCPSCPARLERHSIDGRR